MTYEYSQYLAHHGIKGQKWGQRRYQNLDGSLTEDGRQRYGVDERTKRTIAKDVKEYATARAYHQEGAGNRRQKIRDIVNQRSKDIPGYREEFDRQLNEYDKISAVRRADRQMKIRDTKAAAVKALKIAGPVAMTAVSIWATQTPTGRRVANNVKQWAASKITDIYYKGREVISSIKDSRDPLKKAYREAHRR